MTQQAELSRPTAVARETPERTRRELLEDILSGQFPACAPRAAALGFEPDGEYVVLVAAVASAPSGGDRLTRDRIKSALERHARRYASRALIVRRSTEVVALIPAHGRVRELAEAAAAELALTTETITAMGVSGTRRGLTEVPAGYADAFRALAAIRPKGGVAALEDLRLFDYLVSQADRTARGLLAIRAAALKEEAADGPLGATLRAYLDSNLSVPETARRLFVHPNTIRYRLTRLEELTGFDTRNFWDLTELATALAIVSQDRQRRPHI